MDKIFLMNSAMMPQSGSYTRRDISAKEFKKIFLSAKEIVSTVAYPQIQEVVGKELGLEIPIDQTKSLTTLDKQSTILVVKLRYRVPSEMKGRSDLGIGQVFGDYEYCLIQYSAKEGFWLVETTWDWCNESHLFIVKSSTRPNPKSWADVEDLTDPEENSGLVAYSTSRFTIDGEVDEVAEPVITVSELL